MKPYCRAALNYSGGFAERPVEVTIRDGPRSQLYGFTVPEYGGQRLEFETSGVRPPRQPDDNHWYTFPGLGIDEVIAFRTFDSRCVAEKRPFWTPHSAFLDPNAGPGAPARESVEMRALCLFGIQ